MTTYIKRGFWKMKENVLADAKAYNYPAEWKKASGGAFTSAHRNGWMEEATAHMQSPKAAMGHWTRENLIADATKYTTRSDWKKNSASAYTTAIRKGLLVECCAHMVRHRKPDGHWTKERVIENAQLYQTIASWSLSESGAYDAAKEYGWMEEATAHMVRVFSHGERTIYALLLQYGIPFVYQKRFDDLRYKALLPLDFYLPDFDLAIEFHGRQHFAVSKNSMFKRDFENMQRRDTIKRQYATAKGMVYLEIETPIEKEIERIILQQVDAIAQANGKEFHPTKRPLTEDEEKTLATLGVWTKEAVLADAQKYGLLMDWANCRNAAYQIACKNGWAEEATAHMARSQKPKGYWTKERVLEDAKKYTSKMEWFKASQSAWATAQRMGWLKDCEAVMKRGEIEET